MVYECKGARHRHPSSVLRRESKYRKKDVEVYSGTLRLGSKNPSAPPGPKLTGSLHLKKSSIFSKRRWRFSPGGGVEGRPRFIVPAISVTLHLKIHIPSKRRWKFSSGKGNHRREPSKGTSRGTSEGNQRREPATGTIEGKGDAVHGSLLTAVEDKTSMTVMIRMMETRSDTQVVAVSHHTLGTLPTSGLPQAHSPASHAR